MDHSWTEGNLDKALIIRVVECRHCGQTEYADNTNLADSCGGNAAREVRAKADARYKQDLARRVTPPSEIENPWYLTRDERGY